MIRSFRIIILPTLLFWCMCCMYILYKYIHTCMCRRRNRGRGRWGEQIQSSRFKVSNLMWFGAGCVVGGVYVVRASRWVNAINLSTEVDSRSRWVNSTCTSIFSKERKGSLARGIDWIWPIWSLSQQWVFGKLPEEVLSINFLCEDYFSAQFSLEILFAKSSSGNSTSGKPNLGKIILELPPQRALHKNAALESLSRNPFSNRFYWSSCRSSCIDRGVEVAIFLGSAVKAAFSQMLYLTISKPL